MTEGMHGMFRTESGHKMNDETIKTDIMVQTAPWPFELEKAVKELLYLPGWKIWLADEDRGQGCGGLTLNIMPDKPDSYHPERAVNTRFLYPVPATAFNRESWEEWLWARIEETEGHERAEWFRFNEIPNSSDVRRPFKPAHPDGWDPGVVRSVVSDTVTNTPNAGRLVQFPCKVCDHNHHGRMGEHFVISEDRGCIQGEACDCGKSFGARRATEDTGEAEIFISGLRFVVAPGEYSGKDLRYFMHPPLSDMYTLFIDQTDDIEEITNSDIVMIKNGMLFYSKPRSSDV